MGKWVHRLTEKDLETQTAVCIMCGPTKLVKAGQSWNCETSARESLNRRLDKLKNERAIRKANKPPKKHPTYGITYQEIATLKYRRGCFICGDTSNVHLDHEHATGRLRGCFVSSTTLLLVSFMTTLTISNAQ